MQLNTFPLAVEISTCLTLNFDLQFFDCSSTSPFIVPKTRSKCSFLTKLFLDSTDLLDWYCRKNSEPSNQSK